MASTIAYVAVASQPTNSAVRLDPGARKFTGEPIRLSDAAPRLGARQQAQL
jgi:hypothetical protein